MSTVVNFEVSFKMLNIENIFSIVKNSLSVSNLLHFCNAASHVTLGVVNDKTDISFRIQLFGV